MSFASGRYQVQRFLGEGAKKRVYLARDARLERDVAIALIKTDGLDAEGLTRVRREAQAMGRLGDHPHVVTVYDIGDEAGQPYIISQYMAGGDVGALLQQADDHRLPLARALAISDQVCQALEHAHALGIIHRDLKPGNVWLAQDGTAKLGDFGLAVALDRSRLTIAGMMVGTVAYMAPEQALGRAPDSRADLYSLGAMLYEMITGRPPFLGDDVVAIISQHINTAPVAPSWHNAEVPRSLEALILRLLSKAPEERPQDGKAVREALAAIAKSASTVAERVVQEEANPLDRLAGGVFVGREEELDGLRAGLEDALSARGRLLMLVGEPGIGKTRTSEELATYASLRACQVLWGRCYEGEGAPAYWPWVQVIRSFVHDRDPAALLSEMGPGAADIAQVVSEVRERLPGLPEPPALEPEQARFRLFDSITTFLRNASKAQPLVVVLDDLHWADKPSLLLLQFLARELKGARLLIIGTYRDIELRRQHPLAQMLGELTREQLSERILLRGLTEHDVARFIEMTAGINPPGQLVAAVYKETEGNPFFVNEIVRLLVTDGRLERPEEVKSWSVTIPQGVREVVGRRLDHLSEACNQVLTIGSVIGREFSQDVLQRVTDMSSDQLLEAIEEALAARVIGEVPRAPRRYSFAHALIRETLYDELTTTRRLRLHRQVAEALEALYGAKPDAHLAELAYHFCEAALGGGDVEKAIEYAQRAGQRATALYAYEEAVEHSERAVQVLELRPEPDEALRCELLLRLGESQDRAGDATAAKETLLSAARLAKTLDAPEQLARAALGFVGKVVGIVEIGKVEESLVALLEEALGALPSADSALRAKLLGRLAMELYFFPASQERRQSLSGQAVEMARRVGDPAALAYVLRAAHVATWGPDNTHERLAMAKEVVSLAQEAGDSDMALIGTQWLGVALLELGEIQAARDEFARYEREAQRMRQPAHIWLATLTRAMAALMEGRFQEAETFAQQALSIGQGPYPQTALAAFALQLATLRQDQGGLEEVESALQRFAEQYTAVAGFAWSAPFIHSELGRHEEARAEVDNLAANNFEDIPRDALWLGTMSIICIACVNLGDVSRAATLYDLLLPCAELNITMFGGVCWGSTARSLASLATTLGRWGEAEEHFLAALEANRKIGARPWVARTQHDYAKMLLARGAPGDREKALLLLSEALETSQEIGQTSIFEKCLALKLRAQGIDPASIQTSIDAVVAAVSIEQPDLRPHAAPDGTVTIMFSDIEGSTEINERLGDQRWMELLRSHNAIVREQVRAHSGFEVKSQGDGFMIAFGSARRALQCAIAIQRAFAEQNASSQEPVRVRIGLHTGEAIKEADDFYGHHVNLAARIADQARGGEILVSSLLRDLTDSAGEFAFDDGRSVELKGLSGTHRVQAVEWHSRAV